MSTLKKNNLNKTFIVGVDKSMEDLLPWCVNNIRKHNPNIPITIADFSVSPNTRRWIEENADSILRYNRHHSNPWFYKPQTLLDSTYEYKCWIDIDCEVTDNIEDIFQYCNDNSIGCTNDPCRRKEKPDQEWIATGVVVVKGKPNILKEWVQNSKTTTLRGDQEVLHDILEKKKEYKQNIIEMPIEYQWLRLMKTDNPNKKIMHWTGPRGKEYIRKNLI